MKRIGILTGGGDCPGLNAVIRAAVRTLIREYNLEVVGTSGEVLDPYSVDFSKPGSFRFRQKPGTSNSLGLVKFMFPNDFNIYLHDTPNDELFKKDVRAFSHGCIRLEKPAELAQWVLGWPADRVQSAMHDGNNKQVTLPHKIPVYIVYFTAFVENGQLAFGNDLYERDNKLVEALSKVAVPAEQVKQAQDALRKLAKG